MSAPRQRGGAFGGAGARGTPRESRNRARRAASGVAGSATSTVAVSAPSRSDGGGTKPLWSRKFAADRSP